MPITWNGAPVESARRSVREPAPFSMRKRYFPAFTFRNGHTLPFTRMWSPKKVSCQSAGYLREPSALKLRSWIASGISNSPAGKARDCSKASRISQKPARPM